MYQSLIAFVLLTSNKNGPHDGFCNVSGQASILDAVRMLAFRNGARPQLYDSLELDDTVKQNLVLHLSNRGIMCIIEAGAAEDFLAVLVLSLSKAPDSELFSHRQKQAR